MPKNITLYRIFIASPNDVKDERLVAKNVVDELNLLFRNKSLMIELVGWETHTYPSTGIDAQDVINKQINDDYDIFLGVLWSKFGTPTNRDDSGTKEEFERAFLRNNTNSKDVSILFYFKNTPIDFDEIDPEEIAKIKKFKTDISYRGVKYGQFKSVDEFEKILRLNLSTLLNQLIITDENNLHLNKPTTIGQQPVEVIDNTDRSPAVNINDLGYFEALDTAIRLMSDSEPIITRISKHISTLSGNLNAKTDKIEQIVASVVPMDKSKETKKIIDSTAKDMDRFNGNIRKELSLLSEKFNNAIKYFNQAFVIYSTFSNNSQDRESLIDSVHSLETGFANGIIGISAMKESILNTPNLTTKFGISRNESVKVLTEVLNEFEIYKNLTVELLNTISATPQNK